jgi:hypothetical protein
MNMTTKSLRFLALCLAVGLTACEKEAPFTPIEPIEGTHTIEVGSKYENQVFIELETGKVTSKPANSWDIAFESAGGMAIRTNSAKKAGVSRTGTTDFASVTTVPATNTFRYDDISGDLTKTAIGAWGSSTGTSDGQVYVINLGNNPPSSAEAIGFKKFVINSFSNGKYNITHANLDGTHEHTVEVAVDPRFNFTYFSFNNGKVEVEPEKGKWDVVISGATVPGGGPPGSFIVTLGAFTNRYDGVQVAVDNPGAELAPSDNPDAPINTFPSSNSRYEAITKADYHTLANASLDAHTMGRSWWQILAPHSGQNYKVYDWKTYILQNKEGKFFKLRFLTFKGGPDVTVGYPSFEYKELL